MQHEATKAAMCANACNSADLAIAAKVAALGLALSAARAGLRQSSPGVFFFHIPRHSPDSFPLRGGIISHLSGKGG